MFNLKHPPLAFADVIYQHFWLKNKEICQQIERWVSEMSQSLTEMEDSNYVISYSLETLKEQQKVIKEMFTQMESQFKANN